MENQPNGGVSLENFGAAVFLGVLLSIPVLLGMYLFGAL